MRACMFRTRTRIPKRTAVKTSKIGMMQYSVRLGESCHILNGVIESAEVILKDCINPKPQIILTPVMSLLILEMMFPEGFAS